MEFHEVASIFPMMEGEEYKTLRDDIKAHGLIEPIWTHEGKIIDGRNRYRACMELGIEPQYQEWDGVGSLIAFIVSLNLFRRHLTSGQRATCALEIEKILAAELKEKEYLRKTTKEIFPESIQARDQAAKIMHTNPHYVTDAKALATYAPSLFDKVKAGTLTLSRAKTEFKKHKKREAVKFYSEQVANVPVIAKEFNVIYADPPWQYTAGTNNLNGVVDQHYATLPIEEIKSYLFDMKINVTQEAVLFLWVTNPFLELAFQVVKAWGFEYKTNIVWIKRNLKKPGVGYYVRGRHELLFICTRGSFTPLDPHLSPPIGSVIEAPIGEHSEKPEIVYDIIEKLYPGCTYLELFARNKRNGWDCLGDESC